MSDDLDLDAAECELADEEDAHQITWEMWQKAERDKAALLAALELMVATWDTHLAHASHYRGYTEAKAAIKQAKAES